MTAGEFTRKLKEAIKAEGYTSNNVTLISIIDLNLSDPYKNPVFKVSCLGNNNELFEVIIED